jgi:hypothetical protein
MPLHVLPKSKKVAQPKKVYEVVLLACKSVNRGSRGISLIGCYLERTWRICFPSIIISSAIMGNMKVNFLPFLTVADMLLHATVKKNKRNKENC